MRSKELREKDIIDFWNNLNAYPKTHPITQNPPEPDYSIETSDGLIGIEHTSLTHERDSNGVDIVMHNVLARKIVNNAWALFKAEFEVKLHVTVTFECTYGLAIKGNPIFLSASDIKPLSNYIFSLVKRNFPKKEKGIVEFDWRHRLHNKIAQISILNTDHFDGDCWSEISGGVVPFLSNDHLQERINRKNSKPKNYSNVYYSLWLVLVENEVRFHTYFDVGHSDFNEHIYDTTFDRIYIFRRQSSQIFELMTNKIIESDL